MITEKYCNGCKQIRPASAFYSDKARHDGLRYQCKGCLKPKEREKINERGRKYAAAHKEKRQLYRRQWAKKNKDRLRAYMRKYKKVKNARGPRSVPSKAHVVSLLIRDGMHPKDIAAAVSVHVAYVYAVKRSVNDEHRT